MRTAAPRSRFSAARLTLRATGETEPPRFFQIENGVVGGKG